MNLNFEKWQIKLAILNLIQKLELGATRERMGKYENSNFKAKSGFPVKHLSLSQMSALHYRKQHGNVKENFVLSQLRCKRILKIDFLFPFSSVVFPNKILKCLCLSSYQFVDYFSCIIYNFFIQKSLGRERLPRHPGSR